MHYVLKKTKYKNKKKMKKLKQPHVLPNPEITRLTQILIITKYFISNIILGKKY